VTDNEGATDATSSNVTVTTPTANTPPTAAFTSSCADLDCTFTDQSTDSDGSVVSWSWDFGDSNTSTAQNPSHSYAAGGTYTVSLTVTDDDGDSDATSEDVTVTAGGGPFDPSDVPNMLMWLKADAITGLSDGDSVGTWPDASGNGKNATQSTWWKRPIYNTNQVNGLPALKFDAYNDGLSTSANPPKSTTIIAVYKSRAGASGKTLNGGFSFFIGPYVSFYRNYTGAFVTGPGVTSGRWLIHTIRQGSRAELFIDGVAKGSTNRTANPGNILLAGQGTYGQKLDGSIAEVLVYSRKLTDTELADVHAWLQARYAIP
jgi:hypothetical protein